MKIITGLEESGSDTKIKKLMFDMLTSMLSVHSQVTKKGLLILLVWDETMHQVLEQLELNLLKLEECGDSGEGA